MGTAPVDIFIDLTRWPLVVTTPPQGDVSDAQLQDFLTRYTAVLRSHAGERHVDVLDLSGNVGLSARQRQMLNTWTNEVMPTLACPCIGNALVFSSPLLRGMLTAMLWMRPNQRYPTRVFADVGAAVEWGMGLLSSTREQPPPRVSGAAR